MGFHIQYDIKKLYYHGNIMNFYYQDNFWGGLLSKEVYTFSLKGNSWDFSIIRTVYNFTTKIAFVMLLSREK